ncbi:caspase family protein [Sphingomonas sp. GC_Shp_3]|uniref:caspase family protein n=1 Tax=Sphingomonas sp. GC_Shp_3 TaxID=2937383 RepID=UPI00226A4EB7|nr:caspase family protein [Sphingomonas sp. GC_Shp_3]
MSSVAVLIGNAVYERENHLECCAHDVAAMQALLEATGRFDKVHAHVNADADGIRNALREALPEDTRHDEIFFYFSGHGDQVASELFYCGTDYDGRRPNATGVSQNDLIDILRAATPETLVMVVDACFSGALLVKDIQALKPVKKEGLRNVLQFSSSLDDQTSQGGDVLSEFTRAFLEASVRKTEGAVYYTDLVNTLRDDFLGNDDQTPFFVSQGTGREVFVDDAAKLSDFRTELKTKWANHDDEGHDVSETDDQDEYGAVQVLPPLTPKQLLEAAEEQMGTVDDAKALTAALFDGLVAAFNESDFTNFFDAATIEHNDFNEPATRDFIVRVLSREVRPDRMVTAEVKTKRRTDHAWATATMGLMAAMNPDWTESLDLRLNCRLDRAQFKLTLTPKYRTLQQIELVLSCAPSLERCYVFELLTQHMRTDWNAFADEGREITRRWYKVDWGGSVDRIIANAREAVDKAVRDHIEAATKRLSEG